MYVTHPIAGTAASQSNPSASTGNGQSLDTTFAQLLVAQLKSQDPLNPMDPTQFVSHSIGQNTTFNGTTIFALSTTTAANPDKLTGATNVNLTDSMQSGDTFKITAGGSSFQYTFTTGDKVQDMVNQINGSTLGVTASVTGGKLVLVDQKGRGNLAVDSTSTAAEFGAFTNPTGSGTGTMSIYLGDGTSASQSSVSVTLDQFDSGSMNGVSLTTANLSTQAGARSALITINSAVASVASLRGSIGAGMNRLQAATNVINTQTQNLTTAEDGIRSADIGQEVANLTKYNILSSTGISALAQANQMQQSVLKLLQ